MPLMAPLRDRDKTKQDAETRKAKSWVWHQPHHSAQALGVILTSLPITVGFLTWIATLTTHADFWDC